MRILIVGGGVAGLTLAGKLVQQGRAPVVVEKAPEYLDVGYGLGIFPLGSCVLHGLGVYDDFFARASVPERYEIADERGRVLSTMPYSAFSADVGPVVMLPRSDLIDVLREACRDVPIRMGTSVLSVEQRSDTVSVVFSDGERDEFDLVVGCDGIDSAIRKMVFGPQPVFDTGWTLRTWWTKEASFPPEITREYWGAGRWFGVFPVSGRTMCIAGGPAASLGAHDEAEESVRKRLGDLLRPWCERDPVVAQAVAEGESYFLWPMRDVRSSVWRKGRVVLCGDSATAFLPTAGVGASCAMRAAAALADELSRADALLVPLALELFEKRARRLIEANQSDSRWLSRFSFVQNRFLAWVRDLLLRVYPPEWALSEILKSMRTPL